MNKDLVEGDHVQITGDGSLVVWKDAEYISRGYAAKYWKYFERIEDKQ